MSNADIEINWYDSNGDRTKTILEVVCNTKKYQLVLKKTEIDKKEIEIVNWFDDVKLNCGEKK